MTHIANILSELGLHLNLHFLEVINWDGGGDGCCRSRRGVG